MMTKSETLAWQFEVIAGQIRGWLDWNKKQRDEQKEPILITDKDTSIMCLPVPVWPSHGQLENWIKTLDEARAIIAAPAASRTRITQAELHQMFGVKLPPAVIQIIDDASDDRTAEDVLHELRSLAEMIAEGNRA